MDRDNSASTSSTKKFGGWQQKKEGDANAVSHHRPSSRIKQHQLSSQEAPTPQVQQPMPGYYQQPLVAAVTPGEPMMPNLPLPLHPMFPIYPYHIHNCHNNISLIHNSHNDNNNNSKDNNHIRLLLSKIHVLRRFSFSLI